MNDFTSGPGPFVLPSLIALAVIFALIIWFFVNRASVRANDKIQLLEALLREQKKQNALLKRLVEYHMPVVPEVADEPVVAEPEGSEYLQFVPER
ncbi:MULTISPECIES: YebO family protein [Tatumella]|uniref:Putative exported protein n=1 Tax=Tatumella ptyseos ATCC 33301 TaxID=1005995 RepID=A0A085JE79_9GAMM|nr:MULTISPECIES: YebO family protein [Tatumella]KFD18775.1 putative exported protein [Tatumella ptyseos ATCC 33301]